MPFTSEHVTVEHIITSAVQHELLPKKATLCTIAFIIIMCNIEEQTLSNQFIGLE